jgi:glycosyltransferase involved in cell wall biosynthesis
MPERRPRVLILAEQCNPEWPSLPVVGYKYARALADVVDAVVVTQIRNRENIERVGLGRAEVVYLDTEALAAPLYKLSLALRGGAATGWTIQMAMDYPSYVAFEAVAFRRLRRELAAGRFDVVHRVTPMSPTLPSVMPRLSKVPFVLGPLNGNLPWPPQFREELAREREWLSWVRGAYKHLPFSRGTYRRAAAILAAFSHTLADLPEGAGARALNFPEVGVDPELFAAPAPRAAAGPMTILYVGRLVPYKLPEVVVRAFAESERLRQHRLVVVGSGPEQGRLEELVARHGLHQCVELVGQKTQAEVGALMRKAEILANPSIRELGAGVVVEAMACGMTCVVVDYGAPGTLIGPGRGVKLDLADRDTLVTRYARALEELVADRERTAALGLAARAHVLEHYTWRAKAAKTLEVYHWVLGRRPDKPDFFAPREPAPARPPAAQQPEALRA